MTNNMKMSSIQGKMKMQVKTSVYIKMVAAMIIFGTIGVFRRYTTYPSGFLAMARGLLGALFVLIYMLISKKQRERIELKKLLIIILSGALIGVNWMFLFEAYNNTTVAVATMSYYMAPTIMIILAAIFLRERLSFSKIICIIVAMTGMLLVSGVVETELILDGNAKGIIYGLIAAAIYAVVVILNKISPVNDIYTKTIIQLFAAGIVIIPYIILTGQMSQVEVDSVAIVNTLIMGIVHTGIAYVFYFGAMQALPAQTTAIMSFLDPVSAVIISALILNENMTVLAIIGTLLIFVSAIAQETSKKAGD